MSDTIETVSAPNADTSAIRKAAVMAAGVLATGALLTGGAGRARAVSPALKFTDIPGTGDIKVLNYALALEALEADLYVQALQRLTTGGTNALGTVIPGLNIAATEPDVAYVSKFGKVEAQHRDFLNGALGAASIIGTGTNGILRTAKFKFGIETLSRQAITELLINVEATGVQAYLGAITSFATKTYLPAAASIQATEARHTAALIVVFNQLVGRGVFTGALRDTAPLANNNNGIDGTLTPDAVLATVSPLIILS